MIKYICRRLLVTLIILMSLLGIYLIKDIFVNPMLVNAYVKIDSTIGTYPAKINLDNYYNDNLINCPDNSTVVESWQGQQICYVKIENNTDYSISMEFNKVGNSGNGGLALFLSKDMPNLILDNWFPNEIEGYDRIYVEENKNANSNRTFNSGEYNYVAIYNGKTGDSSQGTINDIKIMLNKGNQIKEYHKYLKFGFLYKVIYYSNSSSEFKINWYTEENNDFIKRDIFLCKDFCETDYNFYIPFSIENSNVSFNKYYQIEITNPGNGAMTDLGLIFKPIFEGDSKTSDNNQLQMELTYVFNTYYFQGFKYYVSTTNSDNNPNLPELSLRSTKTNECMDNHVTLARNTNYNYVTSCSTNDPKLTNILNLTDLYTFDYSLGVNKQYLSETYYHISFNSLNLLINGSNSTTSPLPNGDNNEYEIYNTCSAWYDLPCQLGNATTYVIYNLPLISPLIQLIMGMVNVMKNIVIMIKWYEGLGILFSLFIFILMIRVIIMLLKGSNDDRGNKK